MEAKEEEAMDLANYLKLDTDADGILTITLDRLGNPKNQFNTHLIFALEHVLREELLNPTARGIIVCSSRQKVFSTGADIEGDMAALGALQAARFCIAGRRAFELLTVMECPTVAAISGFALGGGCELTLCCDFRIASKNSRIGLPEVDLGVFPGWGGTQRLPRLIGHPKAMKMILGCELINAATALEYGLVDQVIDSFEELIPAAKKLLKNFTGKSRSAVALAKRSIVQGSKMELGAALELETELFALAWSTPSREEGINAFIEKRKPKWPE